MNRSYFIPSLLLGLALCSGASGASWTNKSFSQFVEEQSQRRYTRVPREVLAVYYGWYANPGREVWDKVDTNRHVIGNTARYPTRGPYSSHDSAILESHIDQAKAHGITGFVVSWWGTAAWDSWPDQSLARLIKIAEKKNFKVAVYWEQAPGEGRHQIERAIDEVSQVLERYGKSSAYLKVDGRPVVFAYDRISLFQMPASAWPEIMEGVRKRAGDFALICDGLQEGWGYLFDGIHTYALSNMPDELVRNLPQNKLGDLRAWAARFYERGVAIARRHNRISTVAVMPGIDSRKAYKWDYETPRHDGQMYRALWEEAIKANPDWVVITSWNEWPEGTEIEPSLELGDKYLRLTAEYSAQFLKRPPISPPPPAPPPKFAPGTRHELGKVFAGRKIAVLLQHQADDREFWAAYCGATLERVTWKDLVDAKLLNASNYPVFIHLANEHYTSTIKRSNDVTSALMRYSREGGFIVNLPSYAPWPMYYDDSRKGETHPMTDWIGLGVDSGFGAPPPGVQLTFHAKTNILFGIPVTAPFPKDGDLRFARANRARVPANDAYVPLVQLTDASGKLYGDAVVYIEHREPLLAPGKAVYAYMRSDEVFGPEVFLPSLYQFISMRLKPVPASR